MIPAYFLAMRFEGQALQQTMLLQNIVGAQAVYMINCRELVDASLNKRMLKNKALFISLGILFILQAAVVYLPFMQHLIGTTSLSLQQQLPILLNIIMLFIIVEVEKVVSKKMIKMRE